ncbi:hypothetical protein TRFO_20223 [Tritrichomonas foetus]|uniref:Uncharacterized protein n=1 Tax=Tritrichomonas foetus TaxID=1144522 RepID=A0A1J4KH16_9EUKA|nr:hypothetical protein TRFO_20223 [Tritrichomonas foetus]|eukprot:OHT10475.1 hypothetical protein TRFO_20223 [Tritrichomonas foetus]
MKKLDFCIEIPGNLINFLCNNRKIIECVNTIPQTFSIMHIQRNGNLGDDRQIMLRLNDSQNTLLSQTVRFLHNKEVGFEKIKTLINQSTTANLIATFSFICNWLSFNIKDHAKTSSETYPTIQYAFQLIGHITHKVPPFVLLNGAYDLNWGLDTTHWLIHEFFEPINERITRMRAYFKPFSSYDIMSYYKSICPVESKSKDTENESYLMIDKVVFPAYEVTLEYYYKRLIMNHVPIQDFQPFHYLPNSRAALTRAIIDIIKELNRIRNAKHEELLFAFSCIFVYIYAFTSTNSIDGQALSEFLQSQPFLSPFCLLGMVNNIPVHLYLFNLLSPRELTTNTVMQQTIDSSQYIMADLTNDNEMQPFIEKIPIVLSNYFLYSTPKSDETPLVDDKINDFLSYIHLSSNTLYIKMKSVLGKAREFHLTSVHVHSMGILLLRCIIFSLQRTLGDCAETNMFTPKFCEFVKTVFSVLSTAFVEQLSQKFFEAGQVPLNIMDLSIRGAFRPLIPVIVRFSSNEKIIKFCLKALKEKTIAKSGRFLILKLLSCDYPKINPTLIELIKETEDIFTVINYIDALTNITSVKTFEEANLIEEQRKILINKISAIPKDHSDRSKKMFILQAINSPRQFNELSNNCIRLLEKFYIHELRSMLNEPNESATILSLFILSVHFEDPYNATLIVNHIIENLPSTGPIESNEPSRFELRPYDAYLIIAQKALARLIFNNMAEEAKRLCQAMVPYLQHDPGVLHWLSIFLPKYRHICPFPVLKLLNDVVLGLPVANDYYIIDNDNKERLYKITKLLEENECKLIQDPNVVINEYQSPYEHAFAFSICSLSLTGLSTEEIAELLTEPIYSMYRVWQKRDHAVLACAKLASQMDDEVANKFFEIIFTRKNSDLSLQAGRMFIMNARLSVLTNIIKTVFGMINKDCVKLDFFMKMMLPSYWRLKGDKNIATILLDGLLKSVKKETPKALLEIVIDTVALIYLRLGLYEERKTLISALRDFPPEMREVIASSLIISPDNPPSPFTPSVPDLDNIDIPYIKREISMAKFQ